MNRLRPCLYTFEALFTEKVYNIRLNFIAFELEIGVNFTLVKEIRNLYCINVFKKAFVLPCRATFEGVLYIKNIIKTKVRIN